MKFKSNVNKIMEEIANLGNVGTAAIQETLDLLPEKLNEGKLMEINGCL